MPNRLIHEKSLYLRQHASNPVDWYPWGEEAFRKAREEDKPIFLSIGYSSCHWCHVMEKECFEDPEVAELLNRYFVPIKVDREERPDIDHIYMTFCQITNGSGGWPLNVFLTPDRKPFFALTYIPKRTQYNRIGMLDLLPSIQEAWKNKREEIERGAEGILRSAFTTGYTQVDTLDDLPLRKAFCQLRTLYDGEYGGFGPAPKFPMPNYLMFLMRYFCRYSNQIALRMVSNTLQKMRLGGVYDHVGYGFHRYSTDKEWHLPHFEKMLYDQALLSLAYLEAFGETRDPLFRETVEEVITYVIRDLVSSEGGFYSSEDADSEGGEGRFYLWTLDELRGILTKEELEMAMEAFGLSREGNFLEEATRKRTGYNILHLKGDYSEMGKLLGISPRDLKGKLVQITKRLYEVRSKRKRCERDNKILADWNSWMIVALASAGVSLKRDDYLSYALRCYESLMRYHVKDDSILFHSVAEGEGKSAGLLDDYASFVLALLSLYEATLEGQFLDKAMAISQNMIRLFGNPKEGLFFMTREDFTELITRPRSLYDGVIPSGNAAALNCLLRLYHLTGETSLKEWVCKGLRTMGKLLLDAPVSFTFTLLCLDLLLGPVYTLALNRSQEGIEVLREIRGGFSPNWLIKALEEKGPGLVAHICQEEVCGSIIRDKDELLRKVEDVKKRRPC
ncbi:MAG: thioredoxin domain-containing protein [Desulfatiglandales bacterium]